MSNTLITSSLVAKTALAVLRNSFTLASRSVKNITETFGAKGVYQSGDTVTVKIPPRFVSGIGATAATNNIVYGSTTVTLVHRNVSFDLTQLEKTVDISPSQIKELLQPALAQLASDIDKDGYALYYKAENLVTPGSYSSGNPAQWAGADVATLKPFLDAKARLAEKAAPEDGKFYAAVTPSTSAGLVDGLKSLFQSADEIANQYKRGLMGMAGGFQFVQSQSLPTHTNGTRAQAANPAVDGNQTGSSLLLKSVGNAVSIKRGDQFTIAGVYAINPLTRAATNKLQVFTHVGTDVNSGAGGDVTLTISPSINITAPNQTVSAQAGNNAVITWMGANGVSTEVNLAWHRDAMMVVFYPFNDYAPGTDVYTATDDESGLAVTVMIGTDVTNYKTINRLDVLYGWQMVRGSLACRVQG